MFGEVVPLFVALTNPTALRGAGVCCHCRWRAAFVSHDNPERLAGVERYGIAEFYGAPRIGTHEVVMLHCHEGLRRGGAALIDFHNVVASLHVGCHDGSQRRAARNVFGT